MGINYKTVVEDFRADPAKAAVGLRESFKSKEVRPSDFDLGRLFEECFGWAEFAQCRRDKSHLATEVMAKRMLEAEGAVSTSAFQNISGQIVYSAVLEKYEGEEFAFTKLIPEIPVTNGTLEGEKIAGVTQMGDEATIRKEADPYTLAGVGEDWIFAPATPDRGMIVPVTWEAVFADRTGQLLERCGDVGYWMGYNVEVRAIDCVIDENTTAHRYNWRGTVIATYGDNSGTHTWDNSESSNALVDWTDINTAEQLLNAMTDPYTGAPFMTDPKHLVVYKGLEQTARRVISATEIRVASPGYATSGNPTQTIASNPFANKYQIVTSRLLAQRLATDTDWFIGDIGKAFKRRVAEPLTVVQAPTNNMDEFNRRIVQQYRVNERSAFFTMQPRLMVKSSA